MIYAPFILRFIYKGLTGVRHRNKDDVFTITVDREKEGEFYTEFTEPQTNYIYKRKRTKEECLKHVETILEMLQCDSDSYSSIQVLMPGSPSVLMSVKKYQEGAGPMFQRALLIQLEQILKDWPSTVHIHQEEEDQAEEDSDDESDDSASESSVDTETEAADNVEGGEREEVDEDGFQRLPRELDEEPTHVAHTSDNNDQPTASSARPEEPDIPPHAQGQAEAQALPFPQPIFYPVMWSVYFPPPNATWNTGPQQAAVPQQTEDRPQE